LASSSALRQENSWSFTLYSSRKQFSEKLIECNTSLFAWLAYFSFSSVVASLLRTFYGGHPSGCFPALLLSRYQCCLWCVLSRLLRAQLLVHFPQPSDRALSLRLVPLRLLQSTITRATVLLHQLRCFILPLGHPPQRCLLLLIVLAPEALHVRGMQATLSSALCQAPSGATNMMWPVRYSHTRSLVRQGMLIGQDTSLLWQQNGSCLAVVIAILI